MNSEMLIAGGVILIAGGVVLTVWWQFSFIAKHIGKNLKSISTNSVLRGEKGKKQQISLILLIVFMLVWFQWAGWLF